MRRGLAMALFAMFLTCEGAAAQSSPPGELISVLGRKVHLFCEGSGGPTVVIEAGSSTPAVVWRPVQDQIAAFTRVCSYDRAGYGWSDPAGKPRSMQDRADELQLVLKTAKENGPFVLAGHSYGGFLVRLFARKYGKQVVGVVLVDAAEEEVFFSPPAVERWDAIGPQLEEARRQAKSTAEIHFYDEILDELASNRLVPRNMRKAEGFGTLGDVPLVVIAHSKPFEGSDAVLEPGWRAGQQRLAELSTQGQLVVAENSGHNIQASEPGLIVSAVRQVVETVRHRKLKNLNR